MHPLEQRLRKDHRRLRQVLDVLERQIEALARADAVDFDLVRDALTYITIFPNRQHHPTEDVLFEQLASAKPHAAARCREQIAEHERLFHDSAIFYRLIDAICWDDASVTRAQVVTAGRAFIADQLAHMLREEANVLPQAAQHLPATAWECVARLAATVDDPLDATHLPARYEALYRALGAVNP